MFSAVGYIIELKSGKTWEQFVRERILAPLGMSSTTCTISEMVKHPDHGVPLREKRVPFELDKIPFYEDTEGVAPAGAIISNIEELSHWLIALMNDGKYNGNQVLPINVLKATLQPAVGLPNTLGESQGFWELLNPAYGMGRQTASYRGRLITFHGGDLPGFHSQVSFLPNDRIGNLRVESWKVASMKGAQSAAIRGRLISFHGGDLPGFHSQVSFLPNDRIGVIVFVIGDHSAPLYNVISYNVYERNPGRSPP